jgi:hypothetical protein
VIGVRTASAGTAKARYGAFDKESIARSKELADLDPEETHVVPQQALDFFRERKAFGKELAVDWENLLSDLEEASPTKAAVLRSRIDGTFGIDKACWMIWMHPNSKASQRVRPMASYWRSCGKLVRHFVVEALIWSIPTRLHTLKTKSSTLSKYVFKLHNNSQAHRLTVQSGLQRPAHPQRCSGICHGINN